MDRPTEDKHQPTNTTPETESTKPDSTEPKSRTEDSADRPSDTTAYPLTDFTEPAPISAFFQPSAITDKQLQRAWDTTVDDPYADLSESDFWNATPRNRL